MMFGRMLTLAHLLACHVKRGEPSPFSTNLLLQAGLRPLSASPPQTDCAVPTTAGQASSSPSPLKFLQPRSLGRGQGIPRQSTGESRTSPTGVDLHEPVLRVAASDVVAVTSTTASMTTAMFPGPLFQFQPRNLRLSAGNVTRALLPFVPFIVEAPVLSAYARTMWPWTRAVVTTAIANTFSRPPFAFVPPVVSPRPQRHPDRHHHHRQEWRQREVIPRKNCCLDLQHTRRTQDENMRNTLPACHAAGPQSSSFPSSSPSCPPERSNSATRGSMSLSRRAAMKETLLSTARWAASVVAAAAAAGSTLFEIDGASVAYAADRSATAGSRDTARDGSRAGGSMIEGDQFGSKAFTQKSYDGFADGYDDLDGGWAASAIGTEDLRSQLLSTAAGRVLEVGVGTGLNLRHYRLDIVSSIDAVDLSSGMLRQASLRSESLGMERRVKLSVMDVEHLEFPSDTFDTVVDTFSLCVFSDPSAALREMARVCKPEGRVLLLENSKSDFGPMAAYQDLTASFLADKGGGKGCYWNQDVEALCRGAGLTVVRSSPGLPGGLFRTLECVPAERRVT